MSTQSDVGRQSNNSRLNNRPDTWLGQLPGRPNQPVENIDRPPGQPTGNREQTGEATQTIGRPSTDQKQRAETWN